LNSTATLKGALQPTTNLHVGIKYSMLDLNYDAMPSVTVLEAAIRVCHIFSILWVSFGCDEHRAERQIQRPSVQTAGVGDRHVCL